MSLTAFSFRSRAARRRRTARGAGWWRTLSICCLLLSGLLYGTAPLATLWRAGNGIRTHDPDMLRTALDWSSVRAGLKQDFGSAPPLALADAQDGVQAGTASPAPDELPAFGESFATTVASHAIDTEVTPDTVIAMLSGPGVPAAAGWRDALARIASLRFAGLTRFDAAIRLHGDDAAPLLVSLRLSRWQWRITRIHLPADDAAPGTRTDRT